jgi:hypothetical protein
LWCVEIIVKVNKMPESKQVTFKNAAATLTVGDDNKWTLSGTGGNESGENVLSLLALMENGSLSLTPYERDPTAAAAAAGGRRRKTRKSRARKTRRYRK